MKLGDKVKVLRIIDLGDTDEVKHTRGYIGQIFGKIDDSFLVDFQETGEAYLYTEDELELV